MAGIEIDCVLSGLLAECVLALQKLVLLGEGTIGELSQSVVDLSQPGCQV